MATEKKALERWDQTITYLLRDKLIYVNCALSSPEIPLEQRFTRKRRVCRSILTPKSMCSFHLWILFSETSTWCCVLNTQTYSKHSFTQIVTHFLKFLCQCYSKTCYSLSPFFCDKWTIMVLDWAFVIRYLTQSILCFADEFVQSHDGYVNVNDKTALMKMMEWAFRNMAWWDRVNLMSHTLLTLRHTHSHANEGSRLMAKARERCDSGKLTWW